MADIREREVGSPDDPVYKLGSIRKATDADYLVIMECCGFTFDAQHTNEDGSYSCPLCEPRDES